MKLKHLEISVIPSYEADAGKYKGEIKYEGVAGTVELKLDSKLSQALLVCIGRTVEEFATNAATQLKESISQSILEASQSPAIELTPPPA